MIREFDIDRYIDQYFTDFIVLLKMKLKLLFLLQEKGLQVDRHFLHENLPETFKTFMLFYKPWLRRMKLNVPAHPWSQFKTASPDNKPGGEME